jgi:hypothetical protein
MRIISNFKDYYDVGMQYGFDPQLPYLRLRQELPLEKHVGSSDSDFNVIGFAGKLYPCVNAACSCYVDNVKPNWVFDFASISEKALSVYIEKRLARYGAKTKRKINESWVKSQEIYDLRRFFIFDDSTKSHEKKLLGFFDRFKTAIFVYRYGWLTVNERLNQFGFQKVLPPMEAFQELAMYVGSYLIQPVIQAPPIDDKTMAEIKGFDKFSFRKDKAK